MRDASSAPVVGAEVRPYTNVHYCEAQTTTDSSGHYVLQIPISHIGHVVWVRAFKDGSPVLAGTSGSVTLA